MVLSEFTGNPANVLTVSSPEALRAVIKAIAVTTSQVKSKSASATSATIARNSTNLVAQDKVRTVLNQQSGVAFYAPVNHRPDDLQEVEGLKW
jgi:hypothetical protein